VQRGDQRRIELQQGLAAGADDEGPGRRFRPGATDGGGERRGIGKTPAARPVGADEIGVAEAASSAGAIGVAAAPEIAAGKAAEHGRPAAVGAFALQRVEDLFHLIAHRGGTPR
jgi:hypothetical protein